MSFTFVLLVYQYVGCAEEVQIFAQSRMGLEWIRPIQESSTDLEHPILPKACSKRDPAATSYNP